MSKPLTPTMLDALRPEPHKGYYSVKAILDAGVHPSTVSGLRKRGYVEADGFGLWRLTPKGQKASAWLNLIGVKLGLAIAILSDKPWNEREA